jgi:chorismate mutase
MASAAVYNLLVINDLDQDKILYNTALLKSTIQRFRLANKVAKEKKLAQLNAALVKTKSQAAVKRLRELISDYTNSSIDPYFEEINKTHCTFVHSEFKPFMESTFEYTKTSVNSKPSFGESVKFDVPTYGNFISDMCFHIKLGELKPKSPEDKVRYANMLGHRLVKKVTLLINGVIIDSYTSEYYNAYYETAVSNTKAWKKCIGQELPITGEIIPDPIHSLYKHQRKVYYGLQTLKNEQKSVDLFIPLLFWFNTDKKCALINNFERGKLQIEIELAPENQLMTCLDTESEIYHEAYISPRIIETELYTNHIFVSEEISDLFIRRKSLDLIRIHKQAEITLDKNVDSVSLLKWLKYPSEEIIVYARPNENETGPDSLNTWNQNSGLEINYLKECVAFKDTDGTYAIGINNVKIYERTPMFTSAEVTFDGTTSFGADVPAFFTSYLPLIHSLKTKCNDMLYFPYAMNPREYQPSGYAELSKCKKIMFAYESDIIESKESTLYVHSLAINFLVIT